MKKIIALLIFALMFATGTVYGANRPPQVISVTPNCGSFATNNVTYPPASAVFTFSAVYYDPDGWQDIKQIYMLINSTPSPVKRCPLYARYDRDTNELYVRDWFDLSWIGGNRPGPGPDAGAQWYDTQACTFFRLKTTVSGSGNYLTVNWVVRFKSGLIPANIYLNAIDSAGNSTGLMQKGTIAIGATPPPVVSPLIVLTGALPDAVRNDSYSEYLNATGGETPYSWSISLGALPAGLSLNSSTGLISGATATLGASAFTVKVTDSRSRTSSKQFSINTAPYPVKTDDELLNETEARAAIYFYNEALSSGFVKDGEAKTCSSIGATGFGLAALCIMAERYGTSPDWTVTPAQAAARAQQILDNCLNYQAAQNAASINNYGVSGFLYHFIRSDGTRFESSEVSTMDMAIFLAGAITAGEYFGGNIRTKAAQIYNNADWSRFYMSGPKRFSHGMTPEQGLFAATWDRPGDETMLVSLLAIGRDPNNQNHVGTFFHWPRVKNSYKGYAVVNSYFGSMFTYIFAHCFFDFEKMGTDTSLVFPPVRTVNWWTNSVNAVYANRQFCIDNAALYRSYGPDSWGISACEFPSGGYGGTLGGAPCEANAGAPYHNGTIAPYAAISCMPLMRTSAQEALGDNLSIKAMRYYFQTYYAQLWGKYGFKDSFDAAGNFNPHYYGIDLGPEVLMIENYRSHLIWNNFMKNQFIAATVKKIFSSSGYYN